MAAAVAAALLLPASAYALGLGEFRLLSSLGQPLVAEIELINAGDPLAESHCFRLSPGSDLETGYPWLRQGHVTLERSNGRIWLALRTIEPIVEPVLEIGIEVACGGSLTRRYTALPQFPEAVSLPSAAPVASAAAEADKAAATLRPAAPPAPVEQPIPSERKNTVARTKAAPRPAHKPADHLSLGALEPVAPPPSATTQNAGKHEDGARQTTPAEGESLTAAKTRIQELEQQLAVLVVQSQQMDEQLRQIRATVAASAPPPPAPDSWPVGAAIFALGFAGLAGGAVLLLRRHRGQRDEQAATDDDMSDREPQVKLPRTAAGVGQAPTPAAPAQMDVEAAIVELADVLATLGMDERAVETLSSFADANPKQALNPWLRLLYLYRRSGQREAFDALAGRIVSGYNIDDISWDGFDLRDRSATLERYGHIVARLTATWGDPGCLDYLKHLLSDDRDGTRTGFPVDVVEEILLLIGVLKVRAAEPKGSKDVPTESRAGQR